MLKEKKPFKKIMIPPRGKGRLSAGRYTKDNPSPNFKVKVFATNEDFVDYSEELLGSEDCYSVVFDIVNRNDSPCFVELEIV